MSEEQKKTMSITLEEFSQINNQVIQLRNQLFEFESKEKKMNQEKQNILKQKQDLENEYKKVLGNFNF